MSDESSNHAVRKALLQSHAEIERIELAQRVADVRAAVAPRAILQHMLPFSIGGGGHGGAGAGQGDALPRIGAQASKVYHRYPLVWSTAASWFLTRSRFSRGRWGRVLRLAGLVLTVRKALQASHSGQYRP